MKKRKRNLQARRLILAVALSGFNVAAFGQFHVPELPDRFRFNLLEDQVSAGHWEAAAYSSALAPTATPSGQETRARGLRMQKQATLKALARLKSPSHTDPRAAEELLETSLRGGDRHRIAYALGKYHFSKEAYDSTIHYYEMASIAHLSNAEIAASRFELAYSYFLLQDFEKSAQLFASIRDIDGKYQAAGQYYYGLLAYHQGKFSEALKSFRKIDHHEAYRQIVPYYIAEIYYFQGDRQRALKEALKLLSSSEKSYYDTELHLLTAQILFEEERFGEALPYFEQFYERVDRIRKEVLYEMGYAYYQVKEWENAIHKLRPLSHAKDSLGQAAMYLLGDSYLKMGKLDGARNAFALCAQMPFNPGQQEASLLLSAKLSYSLGEMDQSLSQVQQLMETFPGTAYRNEALSLLSELLARTRNYEEAYAAIEEAMDPSDPIYRQVYPKVAFGYGMQLIAAKEIIKARRVLQKAVGHEPMAPALKTAIVFWLAELAYLSGDYPQSISYGETFLEEVRGQEMAVQGWSQAATVAHARLTLGYAAMKTQQFETAAAHFRESREVPAESGVAWVSMMREADAAFMQKDYDKALERYAEVASQSPDDRDYAYYQMGIIYGLQDKPRERNQSFEKLMGKTPPSPYEHKARYALALAQMESGQYQEAIDMLKPLRQSPFASQALMKTGFSYQQLGDADRAIKAYEYLLAHFPQSEEKSAALEALKSLFISENRPDAYASLLANHAADGPSDLSLDSTYYAAAIHQFAQQDYRKARDAFNQYLEAYPQGIFVIRAYYYKAESHEQLKEKAEARKAYDRVLELPWNEFTESSARRASRLSLEDKDYDAALQYLRMLQQNALGKEGLVEAYKGLVEANYELGHYQLVVNQADTFLSLAPEEAVTPTQFYQAKAYQQLNDLDRALPLFQAVTGSNNGTLIAESHYRIAEILFLQGKIKEAETAATETIKKAAGEELWVVKSYLLLAKILKEQKDYFNASATLQSILHHTEIPSVKTEAEALLKEVKQLEAEAEKLSD